MGPGLTFLFLSSLHAMQGADEAGKKRSGQLSIQGNKEAGVVKCVSIFCFNGGLLARILLAKWCT